MQHFFPIPLVVPFFWNLMPTRVHDRYHASAGVGKRHAEFMFFPCFGRIEVERLLVSIQIVWTSHLMKEYLIHVLLSCIVQFFLGA
jgi:hypothetical protein